MTTSTTTSEETRMAQTVNIDSSGLTMGLYDAEPAGEARGAVVVFQEAFGVNDHIEDLCNRLAAAGYRAVAPHIFHRTGDPTIAYDDMAEVMNHVMKLSGPDLEADLDASLAYLADQGFGPERVGVVGFCAGGSITFMAAAYRKLGAAVTFYGGGITDSRFGIPPLLDLAPTLQTPWLGLFGDQDQGIRPDQVEALRVGVGDAKVPTEIVRYPDAEHGFNCDARTSYHEASAKDGWQRMLDWFDTHLARS
jgi:carboxymethylenebutenolidase